VLLHLFLEGIEIVVRPDLKTDPGALRLRALARDDGMVVDRGGEIDRVLVLAGHGEPEDLGVVLDLLVEVGDLVGGVSDLLDADHADLHSCVFDIARTSCAAARR
jgi:hypothetical protein